MTGNKEKNAIRAIILSAGQGRRLLPLTENIPKCLLPIGGKPVIEWQIEALLAAGIHDITVVTGFKSSLVEAQLQRYAKQAQISTIFNPFFEVDRKSTRLNSSHLVISYAVFCLKKKKTSP